MDAVINGDIVDSRSISNQTVWLKPLKEVLSQYGNTPSDWEIFRGDSFQIRIPAHISLQAAIMIKATIKMIEKEKIDVRLAIGLGDTDRKTEQISEAMGDAFLYSGNLLDELKRKKVHIGIKSNDPGLDRELNMLLRLGLVIMDNWSANSAEVTVIMISEEGITQKELSQRLGIAQSSVNERISRGAIYEILDMERYFRERIEDYN